MMNMRRVLSIFFIGSIASAFSAPRSNQVLIDIAKETVDLAKTDTTLQAKLVPVIGNGTQGQPQQQAQQPVQQADVTKMSRVTLEKIRDTLSPAQRRTLMAKRFHEFFNPGADNDKYGTIYYADTLTELTKTTEKTDAEAVKFEKDHAGFCSTFAQNANTNPIKLGASLKSAYDQINNNNPTKSVVKTVLAQVGQQNKLTTLMTISRRIKLNNN